MKILRPAATCWWGTALVAALTVLLAGCATPKIDWAARVGNYTFDQVVIELGPPDKHAKLEDGTVIADWLTSRGYRSFYPAGGYYGPCEPWGHGSYYPAYVATYSPDYYLRLTFGPDRRLKAWKKFAR